MTDSEIIEIIHNEFRQKTLGAISQYLEIHEPVYENGLPKVSRIDRNNGDSIIAYVPVKDEYFLFAVYLSEEDGSIYSISTLARNVVSLVATSDQLSSEQLSSLTKLRMTDRWNKGDRRFRNNITALHKSSGIQIEPNPEPDEFENKLKKLLHYLYQDRDGVHALVTRANAIINVTMDFHRGNQHIGSTFIDLECITMMNDLRLEIDFDIWAWGNPFKE